METGALDDIIWRGQRVGVIATMPAHVAWVAGDLVIEQVIDTRFSGHGLAVAAQHALAARSMAHPDRLLIGEIASRRTAERSGRAPLAGFAFLPLPDPQISPS